MNQYIPIILILSMISFSSLKAQSAQELFTEGTLKMEEGDYEGALDRLDEAIKKDKKDDSYKYATRGNIYLKMDKARKALGDFKKALKINPSNPEFLYLRGLAEHEAKLYENAVRSFSLAIQVSPKTSKYYVGRANVYYVNKNYQTALSNLNYAIEVEPENANAFYQRAFAKYYLVDTRGACSDWKKALELGKPEAQKEIEEKCKDY